MCEDILMIHRQLLEIWAISSKYVPGSNHTALHGNKLELSLSTLDMINVVQLYNDLVSLLQPLNIDLLFFDAIVVRMGNTELCPPGVGTTRYKIMTSALFDLLSKRLPSEKRGLDFWILIHSDITREGYSLIYLIFKLALPGFSNSLVMNYPVWEQYLGITVFSLRQS